MTTTFTVKNDSNGSLKVGQAGGSHTWDKGDRVEIQGKVFTITYVMGKGEKLTLCAKGSGPFPLGEIDVTLLPRQA